MRIDGEQLRATRRQRQARRGRGDGNVLAPRPVGQEWGADDRHEGSGRLGLEAGHAILWRQSVDVKIRLELKSLLAGVPLRIVVDIDLVGVVDRHAIVAGVPKMIAVQILLSRVWVHRTVVQIGADSVVIGVVVGIPDAAVAEIARAVPVGVDVVRVGVERTAVLGCHESVAVRIGLAGVSGPVAVRILLSRVRQPRADVAGVPGAIDVGVGLVRVRHGRTVVDEGIDSVAVLVTRGDEQDPAERPAEWSAGLLGPADRLEGAVRTDPQNGDAVREFVGREQKPAQVVDRQSDRDGSERGVREGRSGQQHGRTGGLQPEPVDRVAPLVRDVEEAVVRRHHDVVGVAPTTQLRRSQQSGRPAVRIDRERSDDRRPGERSAEVDAVSRGIEREAGRGCAADERRGVADERKRNMEIDRASRSLIGQRNLEDLAVRREGHATDLSWHRDR